MNPVQPPTRVSSPPPALGRLGTALGWLAAAQGVWPPHAPRQRRSLEVTAGEGLAVGVAAADALADAGVDLLVLEGPEAPSASTYVVLCALLDLEPVRAIGTSTDPGWAALVVAVRDGLPEARRAVGDPETLLADPALGHATGLLAQAAVRRTPVVLGTSTVLAAAALVAERIAPGARRWWVVGSRPTASVARLAYDDLALEPLLDLGLTGVGGASLAADLLVGSIALVSPDSADV